MDFDGDKIAKLLSEKGVVKPCMRCDGTRFSVIDGYTALCPAPDYNSVRLGGHGSVPVVHVVCNNCGWISSHAYGALAPLENSTDE